VKVSAAIFLSLAISLPGCSRPRASHVTGRPNVLLVTIDTFRADRMTPELTPTIARLAARGLAFTRARTTVPLTLPAHTTIMTGALPPAHGVRENGATGLDERHPTIARLLKDDGYQTAAFVGAFVLDRRFGLAQGFDDYDDHIRRDLRATERLEAERPASAVIDRALEWLDRRSNTAPFFVWIHLYDPHAPYTPPEEWLVRAQARSASRPAPANGNQERYDGEIMYADSQLGRVVDWLTKRDLDQQTLIVVAGDHGEGLGDHGERTHGMLLYDSTVRVPLVIRGPGVPARSMSEVVSLIDVAPTILRAAGLSPSAEMTGRDLLASRTTSPASAGAESYSETEYPHVAGWSTLQALTDGRLKTIRSSSSMELYDVVRDPAEEHDLASAESAAGRAMSSRIDGIAGRGDAPPAAALSPETAERLRALGYVAGSSSPTPVGVLPNPATKIATWNAFEDALTRLNAGRADALPELRRLAAVEPEAAVFQTTFARALKDAGRPLDAVDVYRRAAARWPADAMLLHDLAVAAREAAQKGGKERGALDAEASRAERAALALLPGSPLVHNGLGLLAVDANDLAAAAREFERAAALDPDNATYWVNLGNALRSGGDRGGADRAYHRALSLDARNPDALNGAGVLLVEAHRAADAAPLFERATEASPDFVEARLNLGIALQESGEPARAADMYRRVLAAPGAHAREKEAAAKLLAGLRVPR